MTSVNKKNDADLAIFKKNIEFLSSHFPSIKNKILAAKVTESFSFISEPQPNIYFRKKAFHSKYPQREALRSVKGLTIKEGFLILFLGMGLGYTIEIFKELYGDNAEKATLIVVEKSIEAFSLVVRNRDISFLSGTYLFIGDPLDTVLSFIDTLNPFSFRGYRIIRLRGSCTLSEEYYKKIETALKTTLSGKLSDMLTRFAFEGLWIKNIIDNIPLIAGKSSIAALKNVLKNRPALVINAGPSLTLQLELIKKISMYVYIIAVDTVIEPLLLSGITPDFIITLDAQLMNMYDFHAIFTGRLKATSSNLIADVVAYPQILKHWNENLYFTETAFPVFRNGMVYIESHPLSSLLHHYFTNSDFLECGGSVSTTAIEFACYTGAYPVFVTGLDLAYTQYATHVCSSAPYNAFYRNTDRFNPLPSIMMKAIQKRKLRPLPGIGGKTVLSDFIFSHYLKWIGSRSVYRNRVYNITEAGVAIPGIEHLNLQELFDSKYFASKKNPIHPSTENKFPVKASLRFLSSLKTAVRDAKKDLSGTFEISSFVEKYRFLRNSALEASRLLPNQAAVSSHLFLLLQFMEKHIDRSIAKVRKEVL